ncbi:hypothetical protein AUJ64_03370 [Candidatus Pacearchaeota archaeon CG1_02_39_14]|nr:MAG: hypothetical protein AUJ64_03370 [Candidatus Pacearchaeota archaeon CG1_02_39_14]
MKKIIIVSGAAGSLGEEYLKYFSEREGFHLVGLSRREPAKKVKNVEYVYLDLLHSNELDKKMSKLNLKEFAEIIFIHLVGKFKFEDKEGSKRLDKKIYDSNVTTFVNMANIFSKLVERNKKVVFCCFGSVSDKFDIPYWKSYTQSKKELRRIVKDLSKNKNIRSVFVNVSTVLTDNENKLRPFADKTYWLNPKKVVQKSIREIIFGKSQFIELDVFEPHPRFKQDYYLNHKALYDKWKREMSRG